MIVKAYAGETVTLQKSLPSDITGGVAKFAWKRITTDDEVEAETVVKDATIATNVVSITLNSSETLTEGRYEYEFRTLLDGKEDRVDGGIIVLQKALIKGLTA